MFWNTQTCPDINKSRQYASIIFYMNEDEKEIAERIRAEVEKNEESVFDSSIMPYKNFYIAEDYHQKYYFKRIKKFYNDLRDVYSIKEITESTAAGHINGYVKGNGTSEQLSKEIDMLGLSSSNQELLAALVKDIEKRR